MRVARIFAVAFIVVIPALAHSDELRIASWNIANLASGEGIALRGHVRYDKNYQDIADQIRQLRPDIITLQEIGSIAAARRVLGSGYHVVFESRCLNNAHKCNADDGDIYTAIAFSNKLADRVTVFQVDSLAVIHKDECGNKRPVRGGVGVKLDIGGQPTWVLSVHMKAACRRNSSESSTPLDCVTQRVQFDAMNSWIKERPKGDAVIIAGDLNRNLLDPSDRIRREIFESLSANVRFVPGSERTCWQNYRFNWKALVKQAREKNPAFNAQGVMPWIYSPKLYNAIDFFVVINAKPHMQLVSDQDYRNSTYRFETNGTTLKNCDGSMKLTGKGQALTFGQAYPSDHCPILLSVAF